MRLGILALTIAFLSIAASAKAHTFEFGPQFAMPLPSRDVGDKELGISAGATVTRMKNSSFGIGADVVYHYWPASSEFKGAYDALLRREYFNLVSIAEPTWAFSAWQTTAHVKILAPLSGPVAPWLQIGGGLYFVNNNLKELGLVKPDPGYFAEVGVNFKSCSSMKFGLDATYHHLSTRDDLGADFDAFTLGAHVLFVL